MTGKRLAEFAGPLVVHGSRESKQGRQSVAAYSAAGAAAVATMQQQQDQQAPGLSGLTAAGVSALRGGVHSVWSTEFGKGATAGVGSILVSYPIGKLVTRQQVDGHSVRRAFGHMYREGGARLYQGAQPLFAQRGIQIGIMYSLFASFHERLSSSGWQAPDWQHRFVAGAMAGIVDAAVLTPLERTQTVLQLRSSQVAGGRELSGGIDAARYLGQYGPREFYRGLSTAMVRNAGCNACYFMLLPYVREGFGAARTYAVAHDIRSVAPVLQSKRVEDFMCGVGLGFGMSVFVFPLSTVMKRQQMTAGGEHLSMARAFRQIVDERGLIAIYRGLPCYMIRSALAWGTTNFVYSYITKQTSNEADD